MGLKWLLFLIKPLDLIGMWFGDDQREHNIKSTCSKENRLCYSNINNCSTLNNEYN